SPRPATRGIRISPSPATWPTRPAFLAVFPWMSSPVRWLDLALPRRPDDQIRRAVTRTAHPLPVYLKRQFEGWMMPRFTAGWMQTEPIHLTAQDGGRDRGICQIS